MCSLTVESPRGIVSLIDLKVCLSFISIIKGSYYCPTKPVGLLRPVSLPDSQNTGPVRGSLLSICCLRSVLSWTLILSPEELRRWWPGITTLRLLDWEREGEEVKSLETGGRTGLSPWELSVEVVSYSVKQHTTRRLITQARAVQFLAGVGVQWISLRDQKMQLYDS